MLQHFKFFTTHLFNPISYFIILFWTLTNWNLDNYEIYWEFVDVSEYKYLKKKNLKTKYKTVSFASLMDQSNRNMIFIFTTQLLNLNCEV